MRAVGLLCSPNARPEKGLVQACNWRPISPLPPESATSKLGRIIYKAVLAWEKAASPGGPAGRVKRSRSRRSTQPRPEERTSKLGRLIGMELRTVRLAIALGKAHVSGERPVAAGLGGRVRKACAGLGGEKGDRPIGPASIANRSSRPVHLHVERKQASLEGAFNNSSATSRESRARSIFFCPRHRAWRSGGVILPQSKTTTNNAQQCVYKQALAREIAGLTEACRLT